MVDLDKINEVCKRFYTIKGHYDQTESLYRSNIFTMEKSQQQHKDLVVLGETLGKSTEIMKQLIDNLSAIGFKKLKDLISYGLKVIFEGKDYDIDIEVSDRGNIKTAEFVLVERIDGKEYRAALRDAVGGGVQVIVSLILRIFFCVFMGYRRVLIFDESLSDVSSIYTEGLFKFLKYVVDELGYTILFVSHDVRFIPHANRVYEVKGGKIKVKED